MSQQQFLAAIITFLGGCILYVAGKVIEKNNINKAILAEIKRLLKAVTAHEKWWAARIEAKDTNYPLVPFKIDVYAAQINSIGMLKRDLIVHVVEFYGYLQFINSIQGFRDQYVKEGKSDQYNDFYHKLLKNIIRDFSTVFEAA